MSNQEHPESWLLPKLTGSTGALCLPSPSWQLCDTVIILPTILTKKVGCKEVMLRGSWWWQSWDLEFVWPQSHTPKYHHLSSKLYLCVCHYILGPLKAETLCPSCIMAGFLTFWMERCNNCLLNQLILIEESTSLSPNSFCLLFITVFIWGQYFFESRPIQLKWSSTNSAYSPLGTVPPALCILTHVILSGTLHAEQWLTVVQVVTSAP